MDKIVVFYMFLFLQGLSGCRCIGFELYDMYTLDSLFVLKEKVPLLHTLPLHLLTACLKPRGSQSERNRTASERV